MDPNEFRQLVVRPILKEIELWSQAAENLLVGTALVESKLYHLKQVGMTPPKGGLGVYQIEAATHDDCWEHYLKFNPDLHSRILSIRAPVPSPQRQLVTNLGYATAMARIVYFRKRPALPAPDDIEALAKYWKKHYNTHLGKGTPDKFVRSYEQ